MTMITLAQTIRILRFHAIANDDEDDDVNKPKFPKKGKKKIYKYKKTTIFECDFSFLFFYLRKVQSSNIFFWLPHAHRQTKRLPHSYCIVERQIEWTTTR